VALYFIVSFLCQISSSSPLEKSEVHVDVAELRQKSTIYKDLHPGDFLYDYRNRLNDASLSVALENPTLVANKGTLLELAKQKVDKDGYNYKKKRSRSSNISSQPDNIIKMRPDIRSRKMKQIGEDLEEVKKEIFHLDKSREKARNINADERALRLTKEMEPLRQKRRRLEEELELLEEKERKSSKDKERRMRKKKEKSKSCSLKQSSSSCSGRLDVLLKRIESGKDRSNPIVADSIDLVTNDAHMQVEPLPDGLQQPEASNDESEQLELYHGKSNQPTPCQDEPVQLEQAQDEPEQWESSIPLDNPEPSPTTTSESFLSKSLGSLL
jgi:hypothetical protein